MIRLALIVPLALGVFAPQDPEPAPEEGPLRRKWDYKIMERVYLAEPSGWINTMPWLISSPALGNLDGRPDLEVVTGTEEGYGEWFPRGSRSGRYLGVSSAGAKLWEYATDNNAGRASPAIVDLDQDGRPECTGGSTSGWMVHCFDRAGARRWRYECDRNSNVLAAPASADLTPAPGLETVAVAADGTVYCVGASGRRVWVSSPSDATGRFYAAGCPAIADLDSDGAPDVAVLLIARGGLRAFCLNGATGAVKWSTKVLAGSTNTIMSSPALLPQGDPCWRRTSTRSGSGQGWVYAPAGTVLTALSGRNGDTVWTYTGKSPIVSSPAVGDVNGDGTADVVFGEGRAVVCLNAMSGVEQWRYVTDAHVYSSPALGSRERSTPYRADWPMFRHDPARTGFYGYAPGPLGVYAGSDDGHLHLIDGRTGRRIDRFPVRFPDLIIQSGNHGPLKFLSSPSLADLDGDGALEAVFTLVDRVWCVEDRGSAAAPTGPRPPVVAQRETTELNTASPRNAFTLAQVIHTGGWNPSVPIASRMLEELARRAKLDVRTDMRPVSLRDDELARFPFLYITGHDRAAFSDAECQKLKGHLQRGGFLFAEACCNSDAFDRSMRDLAGRLFDGATPIRIDGAHPIFSRVYPIKTVRVSDRDVEPDFEGIEIHGRLAFLSTKHDLACSWGSDCCTSSCAGVAQEDSYRLMTNIVVFALTE